jgi:plastocyanin
VRPGKRHLAFIVVLGAVVGAIPTVAGGTSAVSVQAVNFAFVGNNNSRPAAVAIKPGESVNFTNTNGVYNHDVFFKTSTPASCTDNGSSGPVLGPTEANPSTALFPVSTWNGSCTFTKPGEYKFYCTVHLFEGTIYVNAAGALPPTASTAAATGATETTATLNGAINPDGQPTSYYFSYGTSTSYGQKTAETVVGEDNANHVVSAVVTGLAPGTTYHFQLVAHNQSGNSPGSDQTFKTTPAPPPPSSPSPTPPASGSSPPPTPPPTPALSPAPLPGAGEISRAQGGSPLLGGAANAVKLLSGQHGSAVHGSLAVSPAGAGGRLEVDLLATGASLARAKHPLQVLIGRLVCTSVSAGKVSFSVSLDSRGKRALRRHGHLTLTVRMTLTPRGGTATTVTRGIVLRR